MPAIFLDRDGVIIENRKNYIRSWADVAIFPDVLKTLARVSKLHYRIVLVTNQSAVGRGIMSLRDAEEINRRLVEEIGKAGGRIDGVYMCPHAPLEECDCRKPKPGLFLQAAEELSLDLARSMMIGDALTDLFAAKAAGIGRMGLVRTGRGAAQSQLPEAASIQSLPIYDDLMAALSDQRLIIEN